jgi:pimeloyl-ACP methyl ester carboxylesterase
MSDSGIRYCSTGDGVRIAYNTKGNGYPLLRALGWFTHLEEEARTPLWSATNDALSARYAFTRYDGRGTGLSDRRIESVSLETYVADLEAVADAVPLESFAILGISQGGVTAVAYAIRHPERVSHLILYASYARL